MASGAVLVPGLAAGKRGGGTTPPPLLGQCLPHITSERELTVGEKRKQLRLHFSAFYCPRTRLDEKTCCVP